MLVRGFIWVMLLGVVGQAFVRSSLVLHYYWKRSAYIAHCENLYKPELDCYGKCYLKKQIARIEKRQESEQHPLPAFFFQLKDIQLFWECLVSPFFAGQVLEHRLAFPPYCGPVTAYLSRSIFHPPCAQ